MRARTAAWVIAGSVALVQALGGCEAILGVGGLSERGAGDGGSLESGSDSSIDSGSDGSSDDGGREGGKEGGGMSEGGTPPPCTDGCATGPSCSGGGPGLDNCGTNGTESCCASLEVEGGTYDRTYDLDDSGVAILSPEGGPTGEADPATVSGFRLDKYLVTVGRFRKFVAAVTPTDAGPAGYEPEAGSGKHAYLNGGDGLENSASPGTHEPGWDPTDDVNVTPTDSALGSCASTGTSTWTPQAALNENNPINCVNWQESYAFCIWDGGFLPSEAELEYAAAGGGGADGQREYPWGSIDPASGSNADSYAVYNSDSNTEPVGTSTLGVGRWGQLDLAGQLWEWTLDWKAAYSASCTDCAYFSLTSPGRSVRGGNYTNPEIWLHPSRRFSSAPLDRDFGNGVRCARAP